MRIIGYLWAFPVTFFGLMLAVLAFVTGGSVRLRSGVVEAWGGIIRWLLRGGLIYHGGAAMTLGHVILARDEDCLQRSRGHELHHVRQFERWGPFMIPAYFAVSAWLWYRGYHPYLDNPFEPPPQ